MKSKAYMYTMPGKSLKEQLLMISVYALFIIGGINFLTFGMRLSDERTYHILGAYYFDELTKGSLAGLLIMVVICIIWIFKNEEYFTRGTMSIYVMKRLDEKAPVHKRALAAPVLGILISIALSALILILDYFAVRLNGPVSYISEDAGLDILRVLL